MSVPLYESESKLEKREWLAIAAIVGLAAVCFFFLLGGAPLLGKDEPRYAQVAREMFESGDWITPRLAGHVWFEKPALPYWLMAAAYSVLGATEAAARLGSAALATMGVACVYVVGRRSGGPRRAAVSAVVVTTSALWFAFARGAGFDMPLAATMTGALAAFYFYDESDAARAQLGWAAALGAWTGASMLAKGLAGPLLLGLVVTSYLAVSGRWRRVRPWHVLVCALATLIVAAIWYVPVYARNGWPFIEEFFVNHHFRRYLTNKYHHPQPFYFYPLIVVGGLMPWTFVLASRLRDLGRVLWRRGTTTDERFVLLCSLWVAVPVAFFSLSTSKLPGYILPVFPGLALLTGWTFDRILDDGRGRWAFHVTGAGLAGLGVALAVYGARALGAPGWEVALLLCPPIIAAIVVTVSATQGRLMRAVWTTAIGMACAVTLVTTFLFAEVSDRESLADLSRTADSALASGERVLLFGVIEYSPAFYVDGRMVVDDTGEILIAESYDQLDRAIAASPTGSLLVVTDEQRAGGISALGRYRVERLGAQRNRVLIRVAILPRTTASDVRARREPTCEAAA